MWCVLRTSAPEFKRPSSSASRGTFGQPVRLDLLLLVRDGLSESVRRGGSTPRRGSGSGGRGSAPSLEAMPGSRARERSVVVAGVVGAR